jgi:hypothetical protein|tara:strand:+ start:3914 stop:4495 length:582 start_codon:yes stop_codon:yes gene_type:complete
MEIKEYGNNNFILGSYIPKDLCDELIDYFNYNKKYTTKGVLNKNGEKEIVDHNFKESTDLHVSPGNFDGVIGEYRKCLQKVLQIYIKNYPSVEHTEKFNITGNYNFQFYPVGGGYKTWHCENNDLQTMNRHLVFMTYLNNVEDGGTEFLHQNIKTKAEKGLTIVWPTIWTHTHRGVISNTKEKYIITGWYTYF